MARTRNLQATLTRLATEHGAKWSDEYGADLLGSSLREHYESGRRVRVVTVYGTGPDREEYVRTGVVGLTTGWRPAFLLMHRTSDHGSSDLLRSSDVVSHVQQGRAYVPVATR